MKKTYLILGILAIAALAAVIWNALRNRRTSGSTTVLKDGAAANPNVPTTTADSTCPPGQKRVSGGIVGYRCVPA
jgi:hypothetical protein